MAFDSTGGIVGIEGYSGSTDCGLGAMTTPGSDDSDILLVKFANDGTPVKATHFGDFHNQYGGGLALDKHDNIIITGSASGSFSFGVFPAVGDGDGDGDAFVAAFDKDFTNLWTSTWTDPPGPDRGTSSPSIRVNGIIVRWELPRHDSLWRVRRDTSRRRRRT